MRAITAVSSISAMSRSRPPQRGHASTSRPKLRRIKSAHRRAPPRGGRRSPLSDGELLVNRLIGFGVGNLLSIAAVWVVVDGYRRERTRLESTVAELEKALAEVNTLRGLLPLCAWCRKVRSDTGLWTEVEAYLAEHGDLRFTHGICPECERQVLEDAGRPAAR